MSSTEAEDDKLRYAPFILTIKSLLLSDRHMPDKQPIFQERAGWLGNGYDWTSIAHVLIEEHLPDLAETIRFDPEAGMFTALGAREDLAKLAAAMQSAFNDDAMLRDLLSRAVLD